MNALRRTRFARATSLLAAVVVVTGVLVTHVFTASAAGTPPWEPVGGNDVGSLIFYDASGSPITSGTITNSPIAAYIQGSTTLRAGDTKATLKAYTPVNGQPVGAWTGGLISATASAFPNSAAPASLSSSALPLVTGSSGD